MNQWLVVELQVGRVAVCVGKCMRCSCVQARKSCMNCLPSRQGRCLNCSSTESVFDRNNHRDSSGLIQSDSIGCDVAHCTSGGAELSDFV